MRNLTRFVLMCAALAAVSCSSVTPVAINAGDQCFRCRRIILDTKIAGEMIDPSGMPAKFRSTGCLTKYLADHPKETGVLFVTDYTSGKLEPVDRLTFVPVIIDTNTNELDYHAFVSKADAAAAAKEAGTTPVDWNTVLQSVKTSRAS